MSVRREGSAWDGHVERLEQQRTVHHESVDGVTVVRMAQRGTIPADVREAVRRYDAEPGNARVSIAGARVSVERSEELDRDGRPMLTKVTIR